MSSEIAQCLHSTLGHLFALRKLLHSSHLCAATSLSLPFKHKSLFSFVIRWKSSSSSSSFFVFVNEPSFVIFILFYFICLIWSEKYILKVEFWSTKHQATPICSQKPPGTNIDLKIYIYIYFTKLFFFFFSFQILHALFLVQIYLFSCRVLKKLCGYMLRNFFFYFVDALS